MPLNLLLCYLELDDLAPTVDSLLESSPSDNDAQGMLLDKGEVSPSHVMIFPFSKTKWIYPKNSGFMLSFLGGGVGWESMLACHSGNESWLSPSTLGPRDRPQGVGHGSKHP